MKSKLKDTMASGNLSPIRSLNTLILFSISVLLLYLLGVNVSNDAESYKSLWFRLHDTDFTNAVYTERLEISSLFIYWALSQWFSPGITFFIVGLSALSIKFYLFRRYLLSPSCAWLIYISIYLHLLDANQIRAALAVCFILYALIADIHGKSYLILAFTACLFHYSGLIIILFYFTPIPLIGLAVVAVASSLFDSFTASSALIGITLSHLSGHDPGQVYLTSSIFLAQSVMSVACGYCWKRLSEAQKKGAFLLMSGTVFYIVFHSNPIFAHRLREISLLGLFPLLFLGNRKLTYAFLLIWSCTAFIAAYNLWLVIDELRLAV